MSNKPVNPRKVVTGKNTRLSYCHIWEPSAINGGTPKYSLCVLIPKSDTETVERARASIEAAYHEGEAVLKGNGKSVPPMTAIRTPLRDGDLERPDDAAYAGMWFVNANSTQQPIIVDADRRPIIDRNEVYSGCYGRVSLTFFAYNMNGNRGIACGLNGVQKIRDGEPLGSRCNPDVDFADDDEDFLA